MSIDFGYSIGNADGLQGFAVVKSVFVEVCQSGSEICAFKQNTIRKRIRSDVAHVPEVNGYELRTFVKSVVAYYPSVRMNGQILYGLTCGPDKHEIRITFVSEVFRIFVEIEFQSRAARKSVVPHDFRRVGQRYFFKCGTIFECAVRKFRYAFFYDNLGKVFHFRKIVDYAARYL